MKKTVFLLASLFVMACGIQSVKAQKGAQASATANATATVVEVITIEKDVDLDFGTFASGLSEGTVSMETNGTRNQTGGVVLLDTDAGNPATFIVHGTNNGHYFVTLPTENSITLTLSTGTEQMTIASFTHNAGGILDGTGQATFNVGGVLTVPADQPAGVYTGTFDVIVTHE
jgi:spore coat protein U-like protein